MTSLLVTVSEIADLAKLATTLQILAKQFAPSALQANTAQAPHLLLQLVIAPLESILQAVLQLRIARHAILPLLSLFPVVFVKLVASPQGERLLQVVQAAPAFPHFHADSVKRVDSRREGLYKLHALV